MSSKHNRGRLGKVCRLVVLVGKIADPFHAIPEPGDGEAVDGTLHLGRILVVNT